MAAADTSSTGIMFPSAAVISAENGKLSSHSPSCLLFAGSSQQSSVSSGSEITRLELTVDEDGVVPASKIYSK